jgi:hypothetical protein
MRCEPISRLLTNLPADFFRDAGMTRRVAKSLGKDVDSTVTTRINGQFTD